MQGEDIADTVVDPRHRAPAEATGWEEEVLEQQVLHSGRLETVLQAPAQGSPRHWVPELQTAAQPAQE